MCSHIWEQTECRQSRTLKYFHWTEMAESWASPIPLIYPWGTKVDRAGLGLEPLYPDSSANVLSARTPVWPQTALCCVALNLVGHLALMLSKKSGEWSALFSLLMELSSFSVKIQLNSFSKWSILHSKDAQWASLTGNSVSSNRDHGACQQSPCETGMHPASEKESWAQIPWETGAPCWV